MASSSTEDERINCYYQSLTRDKRNELDLNCANAVLHDEIPFNACAIPNWGPFWMTSHTLCAFGALWKPPYREKISGHFLDKSFDKTKLEVEEVLFNVPAICMS